MLYDFHQKQNAKKHGAVHATYVVYGVKQQEGAVNGEKAVADEDQANGSRQSVTDPDGDSFMVSSPMRGSFMSISASQKTIADEDDTDVVRVSTSTLCSEEDLETVKAEYSTISMIYVYSLQPGPLNDLQVLSNCNREVRAQVAKEDPLQTAAQYGIIQNQYVRRRSGKPMVPIAVPTPSASQTKPKEEAPAAKTTKTEIEKSSQESKTKPSIAENRRTPANQAKAAGNLARRESSDLFKAFAKGKQAKAKSGAHATAAGQESAGTSEATTPAEDVEMEDAFDKSTAKSKVSKVEDLESSDDDALIALPKNSGKVSESRKARDQRRAALEALMDDDDDEPEPARRVGIPPAVEAVGEEKDEEDAMDVDEGALDKPATKQEAEPQEQTTVSGGRRRGRRKIMKKKTVTDEEGYLGRSTICIRIVQWHRLLTLIAVTTEEPVWESFSEDEPEPKKQKTLPPSSSNPKTTKKAGPKGQGSIMNFFGKK